MSSTLVAVTAVAAAITTAVVPVSVAPGAAAHPTGARATAHAAGAHTNGARAASALAAEKDGSGAPVHRVYATREGLVGHTTANGHRIRKNDHFVALPSGRSLSAEWQGTHSVRVCVAGTTRCEYAPVWDVGPWNVDDDYWSMPATRERFPDVAQGTPQADAAYHHGHNGGKDGFGREVRNPAGIDLADGTFTHGLGLTDNAWVDVTYLWRGDGPTGTIRTGKGSPLNVRSGPGTSYAKSGTAAAAAQVTIQCTVWGEWVDGYLGSTPLWNKIGPGHFVSDAYTRTGTGSPVAPPC
ncbi:hypothetical protein GCM10028784_15800 [Myceligenerans cantabricum]